jgi:Domain of unknown function (DUF1844)
MGDEKSEKGFSVNDSRVGSDDKETAVEETPPAQENQGPEKKEAPQQAKASKEAIPAITFPTFLLSLHHSAIIHLGVVPDPVSGEQKVSFEIARQNIDLLEILNEKTKGNLDQEEEKLLENILYELRMAYIDISKEQAQGEESK